MHDRSRTLGRLSAALAVCLCAALLLGRATTAADGKDEGAEHRFPAGTYVLGGGPETATGKHAAKIAEPFTLHPHQFILSGGPNPTDPIVVDDDLEIAAGKTLLFLDDDHVRSSERRPGLQCTYQGWPLILALRPGVKFRVRAIDHNPTEAELGDLYLHRADGAKEQVVKARKERSNARLPHVFFEQEFDSGTVFATPLPERRRKDPTAEKLNALWTDLARQDAAKGYLALWGLAATPRQAAPLLQERLRVVAPPGGEQKERIARLIADLDNDAFDVREKATEELKKIVEVAEPQLRKALETKPSKEARRRIERILDERKGSDPTADQVRQRRAVEALEAMASAEADKVLQDLAKGAAEALLTRQARASLERRAAQSR
jgi:hypothetical protein